ncbi:MAG: hypothetical protein N2035_00690 [Chthoniobacterales bacterium]|nr:hypothetical protein [Chthoniobacterales bacterium]
MSKKDRPIRLFLAFLVFFCTFPPSFAVAAAKKPSNRYANEMDKTLEERLLNPDPNRKIPVPVQNPSQFSAKLLKEDFLSKRVEAETISVRKFQRIRDLELKQLSALTQREQNKKTYWDATKGTNLLRDAIMGSTRLAREREWLPAERITDQDSMGAYPTRLAYVEGKSQKILDAESAKQRKAISVEELRQLLNKPK